MKKLKVNEANYEIRYSNWVKMIIDLIKPNTLAAVLGRGTAKSTDIIAERSIDVIYDMPRAPLAFVSDTYVNLMSNIVPSILEGWERKKFYEGIHYVVDKKPPEHWDKPFLKTFQYKHTITTFNGCKFFLISLDRPSISAGISVVHQFIDECKYANEGKVNRLFPTLRGDSKLYGNSHYYLGQTFLTDMPDPNTGEFDWILRLQKNMDKDRIINILQCALVVNEILVDLVNAQAEDLPTENIEKNLERWRERLKKLRKDSTFFYQGSSFINADILTLGYLIKMMETLDIDEFKKAVLSIRPRLSAGSRFYGNLEPKHFYDDGYNYTLIDKFPIGYQFKLSSKYLNYIQSTEILEVGVDFGNMISMVFGQEQGNTYRILKSLFVLTPEFIDDIAQLFLIYFDSHDTKILDMYYDRAGNNYSKQKEDLAGKLKNAIENKLLPNGSRIATGWRVTLMSKGQGNITHQQEYELVNLMLSERDKRLPKLIIDKHECKELKSSLEMAPLKKDPITKAIHKEKKSEKLPIKRLPLESTNFSDAFKYLMCRPKWLKLIRGSIRVSMGDIAIRG